ncbi:conserved hypothetical protein [Trichinella spiralis]|uniref:hypothetical protein n=1 Tax=Trichinella spiralis TaxID=6334 RepID=UPI0001EFD358|nr:conserved hypothetical protein [Trichinella spiralis]
MSNTVPPAWSTSSEIRIMIKNPLVNITEYHFPFSAAQYSHGNQTNVTVLRFRLFLDKSCLSGIEHPKSECFNPGIVYGEKLAKLKFGDAALTVVNCNRSKLKKLELGGLVVCRPKAAAAAGCMVLKGHGSMTTRI